MILWPYHDLLPGDRVFVAANMLAVLGILPGYADSLDFQPWRIITQAELATAIQRAWRSVQTNGSQPDLRPPEPDAPASWQMLYDWLSAAGWRASEGLKTWDRRLSPTSPKLNRSELAMHLWSAVKDLPGLLESTP